MADLRIGQVREVRDYDLPDFTVSRGTTPVAVTGSITAFFAGGVVFLAGRLVLPATLPAAGVWTITVPALSGSADQMIGRLAVLGSTSTDLTLASGLLTPAVQPTLTANSVLTIQGVVA